MRSILRIKQRCFPTYLDWLNFGIICKDWLINKEYHLAFYFSHLAISTIESEKFPFRKSHNFWKKEGYLVSLEVVGLDLHDTLHARRPWSSWTWSPPSSACKQPLWHPGVIKNLFLQVTVMASEDSLSESFFWKRSTAAKLKGTGTFGDS